MCSPTVPLGLWGKRAFFLSTLSLKERLAQSLFNSSILGVIRRTHLFLGFAFDPTALGLGVAVLLTNSSLASWKPPSALSNRPLFDLPPLLFVLLGLLLAFALAFDSAFPPGFLPFLLCGLYGLSCHRSGLSCHRSGLSCWVYPSPSPSCRRCAGGAETATTQTWGNLAGFLPERGCCSSNLPPSCPGLNQAAPLPCKSRRGPRKALRP